MNTSELIRKELDEARQTLSDFVAGDGVARIEQAGKLLSDCFRQGGKAVSCGNGGSMSDAMHFAEELTGRFREERNPIPAIAISDPAYITCTANDYGYEKIFSRFVEACGCKGDVLVAISTSGNSANVIEAASAAKKKGMQVIALTGKDGGKLAGMCDVEIRVPGTHYADRVQEVHIKIIHCLIHLVEQSMK